MLSLLSYFCCNSSRTLIALKATVRERFTADAIFNQNNNDEENTSCRPRSSVLRFPIVWQTQTFANVSVITLQVRIFTIKDRLLWDKITADNTHPLHELLPPQRSRSLRKRGHPYILPCVRTERHKRCFVNRCLFNFI